MGGDSAIQRGRPEPHGRHLGEYSRCCRKRLPRHAPEAIGPAAWPDSA